MKTKKKYKICEYNNIPGYYSYINTCTKSPSDGWVSCVPLCTKKLHELDSPPTPIKYFATKSEAKEYLDVIRAYRLEEWNKNRHLYIINGYSKPQWKIYEE